MSGPSGATGPAEKARPQGELRGGRFRFALQERVTRENGEEIDLWSARDALVLKALAELLGEHLPVSHRCVHVKGHGGAKAAVRQVMRRLPSARFVLKTDVASYYASIDRVKLLERLAVVISDRGALNLVGRMCGRVAEGGGLYFEHRRGIPLGCPLSPLLGAFFLPGSTRCGRRTSPTSGSSTGPGTTCRQCWTTSHATSSHGS